ncbi:hypothetical protein NHQ30_009203 [Ciborinia camelliae]|nr:hypothetical protein NHQ30_009203 [Ciborinia camelliae]
MSLCRTSKRRTNSQCLKSGAAINSKHTKEVGGRTPLLMAISNEKMQSARLLVRQDANLDIEDAKGRTALEMAIKKGYGLLVRDMIGKGGDAKMKIGENEDTILDIAVREGHVKVMRVLWKKGGGLHEGNTFGETALDIAEQRENGKIMVLLGGREVDDE